MADAAKKNATYEDILNLPENVNGEILNGELVVSPRPAPRHAHSSSRLGGKLSEPFGGGNGGPGGWWIFDEPELHFSENVVIPDMAGWKKGRMPKIPETAYFELAPDWVCEVVSPRSAGHDKITKAKIYADQKIPFYWVVDPIAKTLECLELENGGWKIAHAYLEEEKVSAPPFDAITFELGDLWVD